MTKTQVLSYGGGKQSVAICLLIAQGVLPKPDIIVMADTGYEATATWSYLERIVQPMVAQHGLQVEIAPHTLATVDLTAGNGDILMPMYTDKSGKRSKLPTYCSNEWKQRVVQRYLRSKGVRKCDVWLGFSTDELERVKPSPVKWAHRVYPLADGHLGSFIPWGLGADLSMSRDDCVALVKAAGIEEPPKSSCYMCPHRRDNQWRDLRDNYPDDFGKAVKIEQRMRELDPNVYLHESLVPLDMAQLGDSDIDDDLFGCDSGSCFV